MNKLNYIKTKDICPLYIDISGTLWASRSYELLYSNNHGKSFQKYAQLSPSSLLKLSSLFRLSSRLLRTGFHALLPLENGNFIGVVKNHIVKCFKEDKEIKPVFKVPRGSRPLNICVIPDGNIYFGEYFSNPERDVVHIYGSCDGGDTWDIAYTFPKGVIRHIHGIYYDPYRKGCWTLTGDEDKESKLLFTSDNFNNVEVVLEGEQSSRAAGIILLAGGLIIPMDSPLETSYIQWLDISTNKLEKVCQLPGSALAVGSAGEYFLVSSAVEPSKVNISNVAKIYISKNGIDWKVLHHGKKDIYPGKLFQYGLFKFPQGDNLGSMIYAYGISVVSDDNYMLSWAKDDIDKFLFT